MPIQIVRNDITHMHVDAIVNTGNKYLRAGSGVNGAMICRSSTSWGSVNVFWNSSSKGRMRYIRLPSLSMNF